jgi:mono/diheme cytochrome c family protein
MSETPNAPRGKRDDGPGPRRGSVPEQEVLVNETALSSAGELEPDVEQIHRPIFREPADPEEGREPAPWWLWAVAAFALFWGGWYLGRHGGTFGDDPHVAFRQTTEYVRDEAAGQEAEAITDPIAAGQAIYARQCQSCHQASGTGVPGAFPPLVGSEWVTGSPETVARILLNGLQGPITVAGETYNGAMPPWRDALSDAEIAAVGTYIRQWEANRASPISPELVAQLRTATADRSSVPWTADELRQAESLPPATKEP